jgi:class 3 adenylate cyclase
VTDDLEKRVRALTRKLERSEEQRRLLEVMNDRTQSVLRAVRDELQQANERSERLLLNILPPPIAERLKASPGVLADRFDAVTVLFADLVGFTSLSREVPADALVGMLNELFTEFDRLTDLHGLEKIKTIGDAYMAAAGIPIPCADHATRAARLALDMLGALAAYNARHGHALALRVGLNTGPVVAGVIGSRKFSYDLWGDTVNTASRMESHGLPGRVQLTEATRDALPSEMVEERSVVEVKGKGPMRTFLLRS